VHTDRTRAEGQKASTRAALILSIRYTDPQLDVACVNRVLKVSRVPEQKPPCEGMPKASCTSMSSIAQTLGQWTGSTGDRLVVTPKAEKAQPLLKRRYRDLTRKDAPKPKAVQVV
jgi:hypothetical protein